MSKGDEIEVFGPYTDYFTQKIEVLLTKMIILSNQLHPQQIVKIKMAQPVSEKYIFRKQR